MSHVPAKVTRPRPLRVLARTRLFGLLDQARKRPLVWVTSPPGSGKTTLVSSYIDQRKLKNHLWYQVDEGDSDIATLFHYLALAASQAAPRSRKPLPQLAPEYGPNPNVFYRLFFQTLFGLFKTPPILAFDNYQEVLEEAAFHAAIVEAIGQIPAGGNLIIVSRHDPPPAFARLQVNGLMERVGWDSLKLTPAEAQRLVALKQGRQSAPALREQLYTLSEGWVAGLLLLLEASSTQDPARLPEGEFAPQVLFDYFGSQVFDRLDADAREILVQSAFLTTMTAQAVDQLTGIDGAAGVVEDLHRRNYFVVGRGGDQPVFEYHRLFRNFLRSRASALFDAARLLAIKRRAARVLLEQGQFEHAVSLLQEIKDEPAIVEILTRQAPLLFQQRRTETIVSWARALSEETLQHTPWVLYWVGMCAAASDPGEADRNLQRAFDLFDSAPNPDPAGVYLSWAGIVSSILYRFDDTSLLDRWIELFDKLQARHGDFPSREIEIQVVGSMFGALLHRQPLHPIFDFWGQRLETLLTGVTDPAQGAMLGTQLLLYYVWSGYFCKARLLIDVLESNARHPSTPVPVLLFWGMVASSYYWSVGDFDAAARVCAEIQETAKRVGLHPFVGELLSQQEAHLHLARGEFDATAAILRRIRGQIPPSRRYDLGHHHFLVSMTALSQGDITLARESAKVTLDYAKETGAAFPQFVGHFGAARVALAEGDYQQVVWHIEQGRSLMSNATVDYSRFLFEARLAFDRGDEAGGLRFLRDALALAREQGIIVYPFWSPTDMAEFYAKALNADIETAYVQAAIHKRRLVPPEGVRCPRWPWPVKIYTLGGLRIERSGEAVRFSGKIPRRPLELLKLIIALGGREVDVQRVIDELWPDAEGDAAEDALATALRRLRFLIGDPTALILQDGKLTLDSRTVWVDIWALERILSRKSTQEELSEILFLYRGAFLEGETNASWARPRREQLRSRFVRELTSHIDVLLQAKRYEEAIRLSEKGLETDNVAEGLYRSLIRCHQALGQRTEALRAYQRCREMLSVALGVTPSTETETLRQALLGS